MVWLYWQNDKYWGEDSPKRWVKAWQDSGGQADLAFFAASGEDGHNGINSDMEHWLPVVDGFLAKLGFARPAITSVRASGPPVLCTRTAATMIHSRSDAYCRATIVGRDHRGGPEWCKGRTG